MRIDHMILAEVKLPNGAIVSFAWPKVWTIAICASDVANAFFQKERKLGKAYSLRAVFVDQSERDLGPKERSVGTVLYSGGKVAYYELIDITDVDAIQRVLAEDEKNISSF